MNRWMIAVPLILSSAWGADDRVRTDNEFVRILSVTQQPHQKTALHQHEFNRVMVYLDGGDIDLTTPDGKVEHQHWKPGETVWAPVTGPHTSENVGRSAIRIIEVELKRSAPTTRAWHDPKMDPVAIDPAHNPLLFENDLVRVLRSWREPGKSELMHEHTGVGRVAVLLTAIDAQVTGGDGSVGEMKLPAGEARWSAGAVKHAGTNRGRERFDMVLIEVK